MNKGLTKKDCLQNVEVKMAQRILPCVDIKTILSEQEYAGNKDQDVSDFVILFYEIIYDNLNFFDTNWR